MARANIKMNAASADGQSDPLPFKVVGPQGYANLSWTELRRVASERNVVSWRRSRVEVEADLVAQDQGA